MCGGHLHSFCPTEIHGGLRYEAVKMAGMNSALTVFMVPGFTSACIHDHKRDLGRLTGSEQKNEVKEVSRLVDCFDDDA